MESYPHGAMIVMSVLPLLGLGILAVVLFSLGANRDRAILPGVVVVVLAASSWGAAMEFGPRIKSLLPADKPAPAETPALADDVALNDTAPPATGDDPARETEPAKAPARERRPELVPLIEDPAPTGHNGGDDQPAKRREYRVNSRREELKRPALEPVPEPTAKPETRTTPKPESTRPTTKPETRITPKPAPTPPPAELQPVPPETPKPPPREREVARNDFTSPGPAPSSGGGSGSLVVKLSGTVVENSTEPARSPHLLVIIDGEKVEVVGPSNVTEQYTDNDPSKGLQGILYTWNGFSVTFSNLEAGFHFVMIDTSLDDPGSHQEAMLGSGKETNDYNGTIEIQAGQTAVMEFGAKNFMSGKIKRIR